DRTLVQRALKAVADARNVEIGARAVLLDDLRQPELRILIGRKTLLAGETTPAPANRIAGLGDSRIDDLRIRAAAERALHFSKTARERRRGRGKPPRRGRRDPRARAGVPSARRGAAG